MRARIPAVALVVLGVGCFAPRTASAQYFGQNQVQYRDFDFRILKTPHFDIYYYPRRRRQPARSRASRSAGTAVSARSSGTSMGDRQPVILYASPADFRQTNIVSGLGEGTGGVTESLKRRVVLPSAGALAETNHVLGHELVHAFQYDMSAGSSAERRAHQQLRPPAAVVRRGPGRVPLARTRGSADGDVAARRGARRTSCRR